MTYSQKAFASLLLSSALVLAGCGGSSSSSSSASGTPNLTTAQAQQITSAVYADMAKALAAGSLAIHSQNPSKLTVLYPQVSANAVELTGNASPELSATIPSYTYKCPVGGTISVTGGYTITSTSMTYNLVETPTACSDGALILNGNPDIVLSDNETNDTKTITLSDTATGGIAFAPVTKGAFPSGSCTMNVNVSAVASTTTGTLSSCTISATVCGQSVSGNCASAL